MAKIQWMALALMVAAIGCSGDTKPPMGDADAERVIKICEWNPNSGAFDKNCRFVAPGGDGGVVDVDANEKRHPCPTSDGRIGRFRG